MIGRRSTVFYNSEKKAGYLLQTTGKYESMEFNGMQWSLTAFPKGCNFCAIDYSTVDTLFQEMQEECLFVNVEGDTDSTCSDSSQGQGAFGPNRTTESSICKYEYYILYHINT